MIVLVGVLLLAVVVLTATLLHLLAEFASVRGVDATPLWRHASSLLRAAHGAARDASLDAAPRTAAGGAVLCAWLLLACFLAFALAASRAFA
jgi:Tfp pilus assembly protein PilV